MMGRVSGEQTANAVGVRLLIGVPGLILLFASWMVTRAVLMTATFSGDVPNDVVAYARWSADLVSGLTPATDSAFVYPSGAVAIFVGIDLLDGAYYRVFTLVAALADLSILLLLWARVSRQTPGLRVAPWAWVVMGFAAGPLMYQRYDILAALLGVAAVLALAKPVWAGIWAGLGLLVKLWPEITLLGLSRQNLWKGVAVNIGTVLVGWSLLHFIWGDSFGFVGNVMNKGLSVEAVAAYPFLLMRALGTSHGVTGQFGSWEVVGPGVALAATATTVIGLALLVGLLVLRTLGRLDNSAPGDVVLLGVLVFIATHKINSLQYGVWIAAIAAVALTFSSSRAAGPAVLLTMMLVVADQVIWTNFVSFISGNPLMLGYQGLRLVLLLASLCWICWSVLSAGRADVQVATGVSSNHGAHQ